MKNRSSIFFNIVAIMAVFSLYTVLPVFSADENQNQEAQAISEGAVAEQVAAVQTEEPAPAVAVPAVQTQNLEPVKKKGLFDFFNKDEADKKAAEPAKKNWLGVGNEKSQDSEKSETSAENVGGGGGGGTLSTNPPPGGAALRAVQANTEGALQAPRPATNPTINTGAVNPPRTERVVTLNTNAPAGPPRPERPSSANIRPSDDRGLGR